ncbi:TetR family transcriptional regulator [Leifsonia sp. McL0607]|uniref:TetR/AcrR family transcriptional regulator n=1 Tax=Leifsonia sp. McL0607 TaxID=3415672 RepID=UPI003CFB1BDD
MPESQTARQRPTGRRGGDSGTRDAILDTARDLFAELGFDGASIRAIAAAAGVDPALIRHFFGDKETLFAATVADRTAIPARIAASLSGDPDTVGARITDTYLRLWEEPDTRPILLSLVRSAVTSPRAADMLQEVMGTLVRGGSDLEDVDDDRLRRLALAGSHLFGVAVARHVVRLPPLADASHETLVAELSPAIQRYLTDPSE